VCEDAGMSDRRAHAPAPRPPVAIHSAIRGQLLTLLGLLLLAARSAASVFVCRGARCVEGGSGGSAGCVSPDSGKLAATTRPAVSPFHDSHV
jgi:hypothetical protein